MDYISEIFSRLDLQHIREFLLHGVECLEVSDENYKQRINNVEKPFLQIIEEKFPEEENTKVTEDIFHYATVTQDVYMEIGMQCGAALAMQLFASAKNLAK